MEKINEIRTGHTDVNAFEVIMKCKEIANALDVSNIILDNTSIDEKEMLIKLIEYVKSLELEIVEYEPQFIPKAKA
tara:strand:+ start:495 stop:722 length:228 start_codon:yes stop_codon:yes gene_type:complete